MNNVSMPKVAVLENELMNELDYLTSVLIIEKNMSTNLNIALNEASNEQLYSKLKNFYEDIRTLQRSLYELSFSKGWYVLEKAEKNKISTTLDKLNNKIKQI